MKGANLKIGNWGEELAVNFLERNNFRIIDRNCHTTAGEIDIVAKKQDDYYFVEVKTRRDRELANDSAVTAQKLHRFKKAVLKFCYRRDIKGGLVLALIVILLDTKNKIAKIRFVPVTF